MRKGHPVAPARCDDPARRDEGFSLMEQVVAMTVLFTVLLGLLVALGTGARGIANGRQRTIATSLAKATIEHLQGSAYTSVAMNLSSPGLASDTNISGTSPNLMFEGERLVGGSTTPYQTTVVEAGATFVQKTYVTAVTPPTGSPFRRITVLVDWTPSTSGSLHSMRFSSLVYPLDYTSYPAGSATAEVLGARGSITGSPAVLHTETIEDLHLDLPAARAEISTSTLRTAHGTATSPTGVVNVLAGTLSSSGCQVAVGGTSAECALTSAAELADNDAGTLADSSGETVNYLYPLAAVETPGGTELTVPAGTATSKVSTDECVSCSFGDADELPWAQASTTTTAGAAVTFSAFSGTLTGSAWQVASGWSATTNTDHDVTLGGVMTATAQLTAPAATVAGFDGVPGFTGAVRIPSFTTSVAATSGNSMSAPLTTSAQMTVEIWDGTAYVPFLVTPGETFDSTPITTSVPLVIGDHQIQLTSQVIAQPAASTSDGGSFIERAEAQFPSLLVVSVDVVVTSVATGSTTGAFTITLDYGRVSAHATWIDQ